jgi:lysophospholipase L1-like esterase
MKVVLIGDSIRMGYQPHVQRKLTEHEVWGPAVNCRHSGWAHDHFGEWVEAQKPDLVHFNFGIHDQSRMPDGQPQILLEQYRLYLKRFIARLDGIGCKRIWATTTPLFGPDKNVAQVDWVTAPGSAIDAYNAAAREIVEAAGIPINDLHATVMAGPWHACINMDGCHMSYPGNDTLTDAVVASIRQHI